MDDKQDSEKLHNAVADPSRRDFIALSVAAGLAPRLVRRSPRSQLWRPT